MIPEDQPKTHAQETPKSSGEVIGFSIAAIWIAVPALVICWIPAAGLIAIPLAIVSLLFAAIAVGFAVYNQRRKALAIVALCIASVAVLMPIVVTIGTIGIGAIAAKKITGSNAVNTRNPATWPVPVNSQQSPKKTQNPDPFQAMQARQKKVINDYNRRIEQQREENKKRQAQLEADRKRRNGEIDWEALLKEHKKTNPS